MAAHVAMTCAAPERRELRASAQAAVDEIVTTPKGRNSNLHHEDVRRFQRTLTAIANAAVEMVLVAERVDREGNAVWIIDNQESSPPLTVRTSSEGLFELAARSGTYGLRAHRQGYMSGGYGQVQAGAPMHDVRIEAGRDVSNLTIRPWKLGTIAGRVSDERGEPVTDIRVRALRRTFAGGQARYATQGWVNTDDMGSYRLPDLSPGEYLIAVTSTTITAPIRTAEAVSQNNDEAETLAEDCRNLAHYCQ